MTKGDFKFETQKKVDCQMDISFFWIKGYVCSKYFKCWEMLFYTYAQLGILQESDIFLDFKSTNSLQFSEKEGMYHFSHYLW